jgi:hypothetical protein
VGYNVTLEVPNNDWESCAAAQAERANSTKNAGMRLRLEIRSITASAAQKNAVIESPSSAGSPVRSGGEKKRDEGDSQRGIVYEYSILGYRDASL